MPSTCRAQANSARGASQTQARVTNAGSRSRGSRRQPPLPAHQLLGLRSPLSPWPGFAVVFAALAFPIGLAVGAFGTRSFRASQLVSFVCMAAIILWMAVTVKPWPESIDPTALRVGAAIGAIVSFCVGLQLGAITNGRLAADDMKRLRKLAFAETRGFYDRLSQASTGLA